MAYPENYIFTRSQSSIFKQIGNAIPCNFAEASAKTVLYILEKLDTKPTELPYFSF